MPVGTQVDVAVGKPVDTGLVGEPLVDVGAALVVVALAVVDVGLAVVLCAGALVDVVAGAEVVGAAVVVGADWIGSVPCCFARFVGRQRAGALAFVATGTETATFGLAAVSPSLVTAVT